MVILRYKINQKLMKYKLSMSHRSYKARKQLLMALIIQMIVPLIFIVIPVGGLYICIILEIPDIEDLSQWVLQFFGLHSCGNAITIITMIKPYRQAIKNAFKRFKCLLFRETSPTISVSATAVSYPPSLAIPVTKTTSRMYNRFSL
uniref:G-protein coupled receptors family 1 profile domain-containing protein n=1 Tax=Panagrolaimus superbus TaxID=310955 RepID=A0A914Z8S7_9BILA